jgi:hypothetical protein
MLRVFANSFRYVLMYSQATACYLGAEDRATARSSRHPQKSPTRATVSEPQSAAQAYVGKEQVRNEQEGYCAQRGCSEIKISLDLHFLLVIQWGLTV